jgi:hypothetical protein
MVALETAGGTISVRAVQWTVVVITPRAMTVIALKRCGRIIVQKTDCYRTRQTEDHQQRLTLNHKGAQRFLLKKSRSGQKKYQPYMR